MSRWCSDDINNTDGNNYYFKINYNRCVKMIIYWIASAAAQRRKTIITSNYYIHVQHTSFFVSYIKQRFWTWQPFHFLLITISSFLLFSCLWNLIDALSFFSNFFFSIFRCVHLILTIKYQCHEWMKSCLMNRLL